MRPGDIHSGMELSAMAGWNQVEADWEFFLRNDSRGNFLATYNGDPVGTTTTVTYGQSLAWIGMVLVHPDFRRKGIGKDLMKHALKYLQSQKLVGLDATESGRPLYEKLGFMMSEFIGRFLFMGKRESKPTDSSEVIRNTSDLAEITAMDHTFFGFDRSRILVNIRDRGGPVYSNFKEGKIQGSLFLRKGLNAWQIGPLWAHSEADARMLLSSAMDNLEGESLFIDSFLKNKSWIDFLTSMGFEHRRTFCRMYLGNAGIIRNHRNYFATIGPEFS